MPQHHPAASRPSRRPRATATRAPRWLDALPEPAVLVGTDGIVRAASAAFAAWIAVPVARCRGLPFVEFVHPEDRAVVEAEYAELSAARASSSRTRAARAAAPARGSIEFRLIDAAGGARAVEAVCADRRRTAGLRGFLVTFRDQSARRASERLLADSQLRLDLALWGSQIGLWELDLVHGHTRWLTAWCESLDIDPCIGAQHVERWDARIHPDDLASAETAFAAGLVGTRENYEAEYRIATRAGGWRWIRERGRVIARDAGGRALRMIGICVDIDAEKRALEALRNVQARLDLALEAAQLPVWEWNVANGTLRIDRPRQGSVVELRWQRVHPDDATRVAQALEGLDARNALFEVEYRSRTPGGGWKWVVDRGRVAQVEKRRATLVRGVTIDIDDRKRLEAAVLDAVNREQQRIGRDLHDGVSQELTGALLLLASTHAQLERAGNGAAGDVREAMNVVQEAIQTSRRIAQGLSSLATLQGGLEDALGQLAARLEGLAGVRARFECASIAPIALDQVHVEHLYRIAQEAATNALRHAQPTVLAFELEVTSAQIRLAVADDGHGVAAGRIGAGLGTRIMKYRADVLGARLRIERRTPRGTLVECVCPNGHGAAVRALQ
jgi:signal transduction histidine kinase